MLTAYNPEVFATDSSVTVCSTVTAFAFQGFDEPVVELDILDLLLSTSLVAMP